MEGVRRTRAVRGRIGEPADELQLLDDRPLAPALAVSAYFFCSEALTNVVKHAAASCAAVRVHVADGVLSIEVRDDGVGGAALDAGGSGLIGLSDRIGALEGSIALSSPRGGDGTTLTARIPLAG